MGRPRTKNHNLPPRMYQKNGAYYYVTQQNKWIRLSDDLSEAKRKWIEFEAPTRYPEQGMAALLNRYAIEILPFKSKKTRDLQTPQIDILKEVFGGFRPDEIRPMHIAQYLDRRAANDAAVSGNREKSLLSHVFTVAMRWGIVDRNPCRGVTRNQEVPRDRYVDDAELERFIDFARNLKHGMLTERDGKPRFATKNKNYQGNLVSGLVVSLALNISYLAAQRRQDVIRLTLDSLTPNGMLVYQLKGRNRKPVKVLVEWTPELRSTVDLALKLKRPAGSRYLFVSGRTGGPYTDSGFNALVQKVMRAWADAGNARFHFHDMRAKGATDLIDQGEDAKNTTGHANDAIVHAVYDRRAIRKGRGVR